ncbi:MAG: hypothetical protein MK089_08140 [Phycisphaerales bacterium]|nr:hypothetical protein [Phycisphaerales bacterium]
MATETVSWNWSPPRPPWLVIGIITTSGFLILGSLLIATAMTHNTRYEQLGFMLSLVAVLIIVAGMIQTLRRHVVRMRVELQSDGIRWTNLNRGMKRKLLWDDLVRFQIAPIHAHGRPIAVELRVWTQFERTPLIIRESMEDSNRYEKFQTFEQSITRLMMQHGVERR